MKEILQRLNISSDALEALPEGMWRIRGHGDAMLDAWFVLHDLKAETGYSPVLMGDARSQELIWSLRERETHRSVEDILVQANDLAGQALLQQRWNESLAGGQEGDEREALDPLTNVDASALIRDPRSANLDVFSSIWDYRTQNISEQCFLLLIPTLDETTAHAYLRYGSWNNYPSAQEHIAVLRYWREKHGATLVALTSDVVELRLKQPIQDPEVALELAREHFAYTPDAVVQGAGSLQALAQNILNSNVWFFWWD